MTHLRIYIDGASKGNPGESGAGVVIYQDGRIIKKISNYLGHGTNNAAEYSALLCALKEALVLKAKSLEINTDSQLLARQLNKIYKVKHEGIKNFYNRALELLAGFEKVVINHVPREQNTLADELATEAVKKKQAECGCPIVK